MPAVTLIRGDVLTCCAELEPESFDAVLCDPPYGLSFMGRRWDHGVPSAETWAAVLRVLKPGAPLVAFGGTRTYHRLAVAVEDAGFEIRDSLLCGAWTYGAGFPKALDLNRALREVRHGWRGRRWTEGQGADKRRVGGEGAVSNERMLDPLPERLAVLRSERAHEGYASPGLKPAWEPAVLAMKPLAGTFAANALEHGVAGLNVDGGRVGGDVDTVRAKGAGASAFPHNDDGWVPHTETGGSASGGRWPSNLLLCHHPECREVGTRRVKGTASGSYQREMTSRGYKGGGLGQRRADDHEPTAIEKPGYADADGLETVTAWDCHPDCPVAGLDRQTGNLQSGVMRAGQRRGASRGRGGYGGGFPDEATRTDTPGDSGGASRFYFQASFDGADFLMYHAKADRSERLIGMEQAETIMVHLSTWDGRDQEVRLLVDTAPSPPRVIGESTSPAPDLTGWSTFLFGSGTTGGKCLMDIASTIETKSSSTTESRTLSWLLTKITSASTQKTTGRGAGDGKSSARIAGSGSRPRLSIGICREAVNGPAPIAAPAGFVELLKQSDAVGVEYLGTGTLHPTLKPISLAAYLAKLLLPPERDGEPRRLLVPFAGAGSEIIGACRAGWEEVVGIELEPEHVEWARMRVEGDAPLFNAVEVKEPPCAS